MKHIKMPRALAEKWLADLRSGEYDQAKEVLFNGEGYCCLGVLIKSAGCEIEDASGPCDGLPNIEWLQKQKISFHNKYTEECTSPYIESKEEPVDSLNDKGYSFHEIADLLEAEIEYNDK